MRDYTKIKAWEKADDLTVEVYRATMGFPKEEMYAMTSQIRRASYSVPANIAEGAARESKKDYLHFLYIARGSLTETRYFVHLACRLNYLSMEKRDGLILQADEAARVLAGLVRSVEADAGFVTRVAARITSMLVASLPLSGLVSKV